MNYLYHRTERIPIKLTAAKQPPSIPAAMRSSLADLTVARHFYMLTQKQFAWNESDACTVVGIRNCYGRRWLLARPILQEYDAFTVYELAMQPANSRSSLTGNLGSLPTPNDSAIDQDQTTLVPGTTTQIVDQSTFQLCAGSGNSS